MAPLEPPPVLSLSSSLVPPLNLSEAAKTTWYYSELEPTNSEVVQFVTVTSTQTRTRVSHRTTSTTIERYDTESLSSLLQTATTFPILVSTTTRPLIITSTPVLGIGGISLPGGDAITGTPVEFSQSVIKTFPPEQTQEFPNAPPQKVAETLGPGASRSPVQKNALIVCSILIPIFLIGLAYALWLHRKKRRRVSFQVYDERDVGENRGDYNGGAIGSDRGRRDEEQGQSIAERISSLNSVSSSGHPSSSKSAELDSIHDPELVVVHQSHEYILNTSTQKKPSNNQAMSIGKLPPSCLPSRVIDTSSILSGDIPGSSNRISSSGLSLMVPVKNTEKEISSRFCAESLPIQEGSQTSGSPTTSSPSHVKPFHLESANSTKEGGLEAPSITSTAQVRSSNSSSSINICRIIHSFPSFRTPQFLDPSTNTPTTFPVQIYTDDNDDRAVAGNAEICTRGESSNTPRYHGCDDPVRTLRRHAAGEETASISLVQGGEHHCKEFGECWQGGTVLEEFGHNQSMQQDNRVEGDTYTERFLGRTPKWG